MRGYGKLVLIAAGLMVGFAAEANASAMLPGQFAFYYNSSGGSAFRHTAGFQRFFINWKDSNPQSNVTNINWVEKHGDSSSAIIDKDGDVDTLPPWDDADRDGIKDWRESVPEPTIAMSLIGLGVLALVRRKSED